ncbi:hypothetical protein FDJ57_gp56 [Gordonia phage Sour]|uniref:Uncharacterized protein n=1 Tax=Gordonia phage Sour TaxID=2182349 RepID=A0A2U8UKQ4_9CAUD|nr:hypothetical protein FDJ57_gp56 [Gordonia phage Sour]AWN04257.1 hypothetical protein PBI_SOUR_56 [Gordonia phage Sour]
MMHLFPLEPLSMEFIDAADKTTIVGSRESGHIVLVAYQFPFDPDTGVPFSTTVLVATDDRQPREVRGVYSLATRLWSAKMFQASAARQALKRLRENSDTSG